MEVIKVQDSRFNKAYLQSVTLQTAIKTLKEPKGVIEEAWNKANAKVEKKKTTKRGAK